MAHPTAFTDRSVPAACLRMLAAGCPAVTLDFTPIGRRSAHTQPATRAPSWHRCCRCRDNSARGATITRIPPGGHRVAISLVAREFPGEWLVCIVPAQSPCASRAGSWFPPRRLPRGSRAAWPQTLDGPAAAAASVLPAACSLHGLRQRGAPTRRTPQTCATPPGQDGPARSAVRSAPAYAAR
jgi:hypothetical protein